MEDYSVVTAVVHVISVLFLIAVISLPVIAYRLIKWFVRRMLR